jgi:DNA-binding MarR family transcriptional regulator
MIALHTFKKCEMLEKDKIVIDFDSNILPWLGRTSKVVDFYVADYLKSRGIELSKVQMILLFRLRVFNGVAQNNLADITNRDKASLARLIDTMEKKNLVARIPSETDGRVNEIHITKHGKDTLKRTMPIIDDVVKEVQKDITSKEIESFISILKKVNKNINAEQFVAPLTNVES